MIHTQIMMFKVHNDIRCFTKAQTHPSFPVIKKIKGKYYLAIFLCYYKNFQIEQEYMKRPTVWIQMDLENGDFLNIYSTKDYEFSQQSYTERFSIKRFQEPTLPELKYAYDLFDIVREKLINGQPFDKKTYKEYLHMIKQFTPKDYYSFYTELQAEIQ